ncbi:MAG: hypothetical protein Q8R78_01640 [Candidatus Omnitrophota bacterium]|nr:hypothetical protein [Candidatus Omnitrophota bacterium]
MLETLISSRIRRTLFEYLLSHPTQYFYLRGLAKELNLSISPLRRELGRLEHAGVLTVVQEANIRFYRVNTESPTYRQLRQAFDTSALPKPSVEPPAHPGAAAVMDPEPQPRPQPSPALSPLRSPALITASAVGIALMLIVASLFYVSMTSDRLASTVRHALATQKAEVTMIAPAPASASGVMRGSRWQVVPGGFGGFSSGASNESY